MQISNGGNIANTQSPQAAGATTGSKLDKGLGKDAFLKLMVAQLRNQDPLNPAKGADFIAQTAQFSSLEQLQNINKSIEALAASSAASSGSSSIDAVLASSYIGKVVAANGTIFEQTGAGSATLRYSLPSNAASAQLQIQDLQGNPVRTIPLGGQAAGSYQIAFDGLGDDGRPIPGGRYLYKVAATDQTGGGVDGVSTTSGQVAGVTFDGSHPYLLIQGRLVPLNGVSSVSLALQG